MTPWTVVYQALLSMEFPRQEYWTGLPFLPSGDLLKPGIEPVSPDSLPMSHLGDKALVIAQVTAFSSITSQQIEGEKLEAVIDFIFLGSKITADGD